MKKSLLILMTLAVILPSTASVNSYLTFGENDTLVVSPSREDGTQCVMVRAYFDGRLNTWTMTLNLPQGVSLTSCSASDDMLYIPYWNSSGERSYCSAPLMMNQSEDGATVSMASYIFEPGYWDPNYDGLFETYGSIKWEPGDYERMCELVFKFDDILSDTASIAISESLSSGMDLRGNTIGNTNVNKTIRLYWPYRPGDVNGDGKVGIADVTSLIDLVLSGGDDQSEEVLNAADADGDGRLGISDLTELIDRILNAA